MWYGMMDCEANRGKRDTMGAAETMMDCVSMDTPTLGTSGMTDRDTLANNR